MHYILFNAYFMQRDTSAYILYAAYNGNQMKGASLYQNSSNQECCKYGARNVLLSVTLIQPINPKPEVDPPLCNSDYKG